MTITKSPVSATYVVNEESVTPLSVTATVEANETSLKGDLSYQWYSNSTEKTEGAAEISGATVSTYTPSVTAQGTTYYYCVVTNTANNATGTKTASATSGIARIYVSDENETYAATPVIDSIAKKTYEYPEGAAGDKVTISATVSDDGNAKEGTLSYQWYRGTEAISGETQPSFTIPTTKAGKFTYSCEVTNTYDAATTEDGKTASERSDTITVTVTAPSNGSGGFLIDFTK